MLQIYAVSIVLHSTARQDSTYSIRKSVCVCVSKIEKLRSVVNTLE